MWPHSGHAAAALPAEALGKRGGCLSADGGDSVIRMDFDQDQAGNVPGFHEFKNAVFNAFV